MDLYQQYKQNPLKFRGVLSVTVNDDSEYSRVKSEIILKTFDSSKLVYMSNSVLPTEYPVSVIHIPYIDRVYVYFEYIKDLTNPLIKVNNR